MQENQSGYIRIANADERNEVATILFKNGYTVQLIKKKKGKSYEYFILYSMSSVEGDLDG